MNLSQGTRVVGAALAALAFSLALVSQGNLAPPFEVSLVLMGVVSLYVLWVTTVTRQRFLTLLAYLILMLPFAEIVGYLFVDRKNPPNVFMGLATNAYTFDWAIVDRLAFLGVVAAFGYGIAISPSLLQANPSTRAYGNQVDPLRTLSMPHFASLILTGVVLCGLFASGHTLLTVSYIDQQRILAQQGFDSVWLLGQVVLLLGLADGLKSSGSTRKRKVLLSWSAALLVLIVVDGATGARESVPLILAFSFVTFLYGSVRASRRETFVAITLVASSSVVLFLFAHVVGNVRNAISNPDIEVLVISEERISDSQNMQGPALPSNSEELDGVQSSTIKVGAIDVDRLAHGTWSAVLLTPLSAVGDAYSGKRSMEMGRGYVDLALSLPPGFLASAVGYERPYDNGRAPAQQLSYTLGGLHASVQPYTNFGLAGVLIAMALLAFAVVNIESWAIQKRNVDSLFVVGVVVATLPHSLWYGEKYALNAAIFCSLLLLAYKASIRMFGRERRVDNAKSA